ncbi:MAG: serine protease [Dehalococcoidia bacterium]
MPNLVRRVVPLLMLAFVLAGCDRAADFIPGEADPAATGETATPTPVVTQPILPPSSLVPGTDSGSSSVAEAIPDDQLAASVALVETSGPPAGVRTGTGVVVDTNLGLVLTSYGLVQPNDASGVRAYDVLTVTVGDGSAATHFQADIVTADPTLDLAVLRVARTEAGDPIEAGAFEAPSVTLGEPSRVARGVEIRSLGFDAPEAAGGAAQLLVTRGSVLGFRGSADIMGRAWVKTDIRLPGASAGAPVFDQQGGLIGLALPVRYAANVEVGEVRPASLAEPLIEAARDAGPAATYVGPLWQERPNAETTDGVAVSEVDFAENALDSTEGGDLFDYATALPVGQQRLHYEFALQGVEPGSIVEERWYLNGVLQDGISSSLAWTNGSFAILSDRILAATERGLQPGVWRLEVWVDEVLRSAGGVTIGTEAATTPQATTFRFGTSAQDGRPRGTPTGQADRLLAFFDYSGAGGAHHVRWIVFKDGAPVYESPSMPWRGGDAGTWWVGYAGEGAIGPGFWEVEVYFDDRRAGVDGVQTF